MVWKQIGDNDFQRKPGVWSKYENISNNEKECLQFFRESCENLGFNIKTQDIKKYI